MTKYSKRLRPEIPEPDYEDPKEVFVYFGLAAYYAQLVEQGLANLIVGVQIVGKRRPTSGDVKLLYENADSKTLGGLLRDVREMVPLPAELEQELLVALEKRNYLIHHFFVEHSENILYAEGRNHTIDELRDIIAILDAVDSQVDELWLSLWNKYGFTEERIERELTILKRLLEGKADTRYPT